MSEDGEDDEVAWSADRVLIADAGTARVALFAADIEEVVQETTVSPLPRAPGHLMGLMNHRGAALPLLDLGVFLGTATSERPMSSTGEPIPRRVLVARVERYRVGLRCERVLGVISLPPPLPGPLLAQGGQLLRFVMSESDTAAHGVVARIDVTAILEAARDD